MRSVDMMREWASSGKLYSDTERFVLHFADEIEREIAETEAFCRRVEEAAKNNDELDVFGVAYMPLPVDADGVPIRPGDMLEYDYGDISGKRTVIALIYDGSRRMDSDGGIWDFEFDDDVDGDDTRVVNCMSDFYSCNRHVKPDTLKELLDDVSKGIICYPRERVTGYLEDNRSIGEAVMLDVRDRLRELLGGDAE